MLSVQEEKNGSRKPKNLSCTWEKLISSERTVQEEEPMSMESNDGWLINTIQRVIPESVKKILQLGSSFAAKLCKISTYMLWNSCVSESEKGKVRLKFG